MICFLNGIIYNIRYFNEFLVKGFIASGHDFDDKNFKVHGDHWHVFCKRCGAMAASDVYPPKLKDKRKS